MRTVRLTRMQTNAPLFGDRVPMPPKDDGWVDTYQIHRSMPGYPQTSLNARPDYVPGNATHLVPEDEMFSDEMFHETQGTDRHIGDLLFLIMLIMFMNFLMLALLVLSGP